MSLLKNMQLLREYPKGTLLLTADHGTRPLAGTPWPVQVWYDAPLHLHSGTVAADKFDVVLTGDTTSLPFMASVSEQPCKLKIDTGASHNFISADFVQAHNLAVTPCAQKVELADSKLVPAVGICKTRVRLSRSTDVLSFYVLRLSAGYEALLGEQWLKSRGAVIDFGRGTITMHRGPNTMCVQCCELLPHAPLSAAVRGSASYCFQTVNGGGSGDNFDSGHARMPTPVGTQGGRTTVHDPAGSAPDASVAPGLEPNGPTTHKALPSSMPLPTLSALQGKRAVLKAAQLFLVQVRLSPEASIPEAAAVTVADAVTDGLVPTPLLDSILQKYHHVFDDVPGGTIQRPGLPQMTIELFPGKSPPVGVTYRLSHPK